MLAGNTLSAMESVMGNGVLVILKMIETDGCHEMNVKRFGQFQTLGIVFMLAGISI